MIPVIIAAAITAAATVAAAVIALFVKTRTPQFMGYKAFGILPYSPQSVHFRGIDTFGMHFLRPRESPEVKLRESARDVVRVKILLLQSGQRWDAELPLDALVGYVKLVLAEKLGISKRFENGTPIYFNLANLKTSERLDDDKTFRDNGVEDEDVLYFDSEALAG